MKVIKAGTTLMKWGGVPPSTKGWHTFEQDTEARIEQCPMTYSTLYVVESGPNRGKYLTAV